MYQRSGRQRLKRKSELKHHHSSFNRRNDNDGRNDPNAPDKAHAAKMTDHQHEQAIERAIYDVKTAIQPFTEDDRKRVLDEALGEVGAARRAGG